MDAALAEFKRKLLDTGLFMKVSAKGQYRCKTCPFCGDTNKHMYVKIDQDSDDPVVYKCHRCNASGILKNDWLEYFGIDDIQVPRTKGRRRIQSSGVSTTIPDLLNFEKDQVAIQQASDYILKRVGVVPSKNDLKAFQCVGNVSEYITAYLGGDMWGLKDRVWFRLSNGNLAGRAIDDNNECRWRKRNYVGSGRSERVGGVYIIKNQVDTYQTINICIAEGIMDAIGLYYHAGIPNAVYMASLGRDYSIGMKYALDMGVFGESVNVRIFKDNDVSRVSVQYGYKRLFKNISIYHNAIYKDYGVPADQIEIERCT